MVANVSAAPRSSPAWALALTSLAFFMVNLDVLVVITALPAIGHDLAGGMAVLEWTVNAYTLTFAAGIITAAALGDRLGRRRVYAGGLALFTAASAACALAPTAGLLVAARAVQGLGAATIMPLSLTILTAAFPPARRGAIVGIWGGIAGIAIASGPLVGGAVTEGLDWHWIFWVNVPIGLAATVLSVLRLAEGAGPRPAWTCRRSGWPRAARPASCGRWCAPTRSAGPAPRSSRRWAWASCSWPVSWPGSAARPSRCCRCGCFAAAASPPPTPPPS